MELKDILSKCDHTLLAQTATWDEIKAICDDGMKYGCASVCIPASYVKQAAEYVAGKLPICTVIGFPNGYDTTAAKCFDGRRRREQRRGRDRHGHQHRLGEGPACRRRCWRRSRPSRQACGGKLLKVIIETCLLTDAEKIKLCRDGHRLRRGLHQDLHRLRRRRRHP